MNNTQDRTWDYVIDIHDPEHIWFSTFFWNSDGSEADV